MEPDYLPFNTILSKINVKYGILYHDYKSFERTFIDESYSIKMHEVQAHTIEMLAYGCTFYKDNDLYEILTNQAKLRDFLPELLYLLKTYNVTFPSIICGIIPKIPTIYKDKFYPLSKSSAKYHQCNIEPAAAKKQNTELETHLFYLVQMIYFQLNFPYPPYAIEDDLVKFARRLVQFYNFRRNCTENKIVLHWQLKIAQVLDWRKLLAQALFPYDVVLLDLVYTECQHLKYFWAAIFYTLYYQFNTEKLFVGKFTPEAIKFYPIVAKLGEVLPAFFKVPSYI